jgi:hypothetical protein
MPNGYTSCFKRLVDMKACKVFGGKTHDCHVIFQKLLPLIVHNILPQEVSIPLIQLSCLFNSICSKELVFEELDNFSTLIRETLCILSRQKENKEWDSETPNCILRKFGRSHRTKCSCVHR